MIPAPWALSGSLPIDRWHSAKPLLPDVTQTGAGAAGGADGEGGLSPAGMLFHGFASFAIALTIRALACAHEASNFSSPV
jgi:hypothetical protein